MSSNDTGLLALIIAAAHQIIAGPLAVQEVVGIIIDQNQAGLLREVPIAQPISRAPATLHRS